MSNFQALLLNTTAQIGKVCYQTNHTLQGLWSFGHCVVAYSSGKPEKDAYFDASRGSIREGGIAGLAGASLATFVACTLANTAVTTVRKWGVVKCLAVVSLLASLPAYAVYRAYKDKSHPLNPTALLIVKRVSKNLRELQTAAYDTIHYWRYRWSCRSTFDRSLEKPLWKMIKCLDPDDKISFSINYRVVKKSESDGTAVKTATSIFQKLDRNFFGIFQTIQRRMKEITSHDPNQPAEMGETCAIFKNDEKKASILSTLDDLSNAATQHHQEEELQDIHNVIKAAHEQMVALGGSDASSSSQSKPNSADKSPEAMMLDLLGRAQQELRALSADNIESLPAAFRPMMAQIIANKDGLIASYGNMEQMLRGQQEASSKAKKQNAFQNISEDLDTAARIDRKLQGLGSTSSTNSDAKLLRLLEDAQQTLNTVLAEGKTPLPKDLIPICNCVADITKITDTDKVDSYKNNVMSFIVRLTYFLKNVETARKTAVGDNFERLDKEDVLKPIYILFVENIGKITNFLNALHDMKNSLERERGESSKAHTNDSDLDVLLDSILEGTNSGSGPDAELPLDDILEGAVAQALGSSDANRTQNTWDDVD